MSNFPNAVYIPTGIAGGEEFIKISGFCYKRVASGVAAAGDIRTNFVTGFDDCLDCNTCNCPKSIDFILGGIEHNKTTNDFSFVDKTFTIKTSSTGWQEIAIESGNLHGNNQDKQFKPLSIRCYDRKIDIQSGIYASFGDSQSHIAHFIYTTGSDIYERRDLKNALATGEFGDVPVWDYINQHDMGISYQDTLRTIKFKSLCEVPCSQYAPSFRIRGLVRETQRKYLPTADSYDSWVYVTASGTPRTPGQIVRYPVDMTFNNYFNVPNSAGEPIVEFQPSTIDLVNLDLLTGNTNDTGAAVFSATGGRHYYETEKGTYGGRPRTYGGYTYDFYNIDDNGNYVGSDEFITDIGIYGINYNKVGNCSDSNLNDFFQEYGIGDSSPTGACLRGSEFIDGRYKIGTYRPMLFTGTITGNEDDYDYIYDNVTPGPTNWSSGVYVFQMFPSGDDSLLSNISGYVGNIDELSSIDLINEYKRNIINSTPIHLGNSIRSWDNKSGLFVRPNASLVEGSVFLELDGSKGYYSWYQTAMRHTNAEGETITPLFASGFRFGAGNYMYYYGLDADGYPDDYISIGAPDPPLLRSDRAPLTLGHTIVDRSKITLRYLMIDSGNALHNKTAYLDGLEEAKIDDPTQQYNQKINFITFQIPFDI